ncbi:MAG: DMT family transporter [Methylobacteriaceae bacterium]|nr:DMT family transporter [Methylobacteriaceae bacterium]
MASESRQEEGSSARRRAGLDARTPAERRNRGVGIALMVATVFCFTVLDASAKWSILAGLPALQVVWIRYVGAMAFSTAALAREGWRATTTSKRPWLQAARSMLLFGSTMCNFMALKFMMLAELTAIAFSMPLIVALIAGPLLGEWVGPRRLIAICVGFVGILVVTQPGLHGVAPGVALSLAGTCFYSLYIIATRALTGVDAPRTTMFYSNMFGALALAPAMPFVWTPPSASLLPVLALVAFAASFGHWLLILAYQRAPAAILAPFSYTQIVFMAAAGYLLFNETPGPSTFLGGAIVIASGLYLLYREQVRRG